MPVKLVQPKSSKNNIISFLDDNDEITTHNVEDLSTKTLFITIFILIINFCQIQIESTNLLDQK